MTHKKNEFSGVKIRLLLTDPWDLVTISGAGPFFADVIDVGQDQLTAKTALLLEVNCPLQYKGLECKYFVASTRHEGATLEEALSGGVVTSSLTCIPPERAYGPDPFDLSWWRGGVGAICDLSIES